MKISLRGVSHDVGGRQTKGGWGRAVAVAGGASLALAACGSAGASVVSGASGSLPGGFPRSWPMYGSNGDHNAAFSAPASSKDLWRGYSWNFAELGALPLGGPAKDQAVLGPRRAPVKTTQSLGNAVGVSAVGGVIYSESDMGQLYAINAATGKMLWHATGNNSFMGNPVVEHGIVVAGTGDTGFSFNQLVKFAHHQPITRGLGWASIYGFDAKTGKKLWEVPTRGEDMSSLAYAHGTVYEATGGGRVLALNLRTGATVWSTRLAGFDSMSSLAIGKSALYVGFSNPNYVYALDPASGRVLWRQTVAGISNTGMGDNSPAVDVGAGIVIQNSVVDANRATKTMRSEVFAMDAKTGKILWQTKFSRAAVPPAYKAGVAMIHDGVVYLGSPNLSTFFALSETTGKILWRFKITGAGPAGAGRGGATYYHGILWLAAGPRVYALNPSNGAMLGSKTMGGRFGLVNPVIVGGTMYLANSWGWTQAAPLSAIYPQWRSAH